MLEVFSGRSLSGRLVYRQSEYSLDTEPQPVGGQASLLVNDVKLELDRDGQLLYVWGYCPKESWSAANLELPAAVDARLRWNGMPIAVGTAKRLNDSERWPVLYDAQKLRLRIGIAANADHCVVFAPGAVAELINGRLSSLWLALDAIV